MAERGLLRRRAHSPVSIAPRFQQLPHVAPLRATRSRRFACAVLRSAPALSSLRGPRAPDTLSHAQPHRKRAHTNRGARQLHSEFTHLRALSHLSCIPPAPSHTMSGRGGGFSRGGGRGGGGGGGGFRGGRGGAGRGGSAPRERSSGRDATSIDSLFNKNTRYDHRIGQCTQHSERRATRRSDCKSSGLTPTLALSLRHLCAAKEKKFWDKSKRLREYHGLLRAEGFEKKGDADASQQGMEDEAKDQQQQARPAKKAHTAAASSSASAASSIPTLLPEVFAATNDPLALIPSESHNKQRKRPRLDLNGAAAAAAAGDSSSATARSAASMRAGGPLDPSMPDFKRRRLTAAEKAEIVAAKHARHEAKRALLTEKVDQRRDRHTKLTERTTRGQPVMKNQVEYLLEKLQKQAAAASSAAAAAAAAAAAKAAPAHAAMEDEENEPEPAAAASSTALPPVRPAAFPKKPAAPAAAAPAPAVPVADSAAAAGTSSSKKKKQKKQKSATAADSDAHKPAAASATQPKSKPATVAPKAKPTAAAPKPAAAAPAPAVAAFDPGFKKKKKPTKAERMAKKLNNS